MTTLRVGDTAYGITHRGNGYTVVKGIVTEIYYIDQEMTPCAVIKGVARGSIGVKVFSSEEEASEAMKLKKKE